MRYAALVDGLESLADFNGFRPFGVLPSSSTRTRMSDEALYALALYVDPLNRRRTRIGRPIPVDEESKCSVVKVAQPAMCPRCTRAIA